MNLSLLGLVAPGAEPEFELELELELELEPGPGPELAAEPAPARLPLAHAAARPTLPIEGGEECFQPRHAKYAT